MSEQAKLTSRDPQADERFGVSVAIGGDYPLQQENHLPVQQRPSYDLRSVRAAPSLDDPAMMGHRRSEGLLTTWSKT